MLIATFCAILSLDLAVVVKKSELWDKNSVIFNIFNLSK